MEQSYWERKSWFSHLDFTVIGSGIVGLSCALRLRENFPNSKILVLEKGVVPQGASTKNAGFACFGSISEILDDLKTHSEAEVQALVKQRVEGLQLLRDLLGDDTIDYQELGGYEYFTEKDQALYEQCMGAMDRINTLLYPVFNADVYTLVENRFGFKNTQPKAIFNTFEGQIDTGKMIRALLRKVQSAGIMILNTITVKTFTEGSESVTVATDQFDFKTRHLCIATNGFASTLGMNQVLPARAQVLITAPIPKLHIKGTFHLDKGYYYFRNIHNRILLGGGRNLDFKTEETMEFGQTAVVQNELERLLQEVILPGIPFEIDHRWSGIMGVGNQKKPVLEKVSRRVACGVRLGGMGVAIGSLVGRELADLFEPHPD